LLPVENFKLVIDFIRLQQEKYRYNAVLSLSEVPSVQTEPVLSLKFQWSLVVQWLSEMPIKVENTVRRMVCGVKLYRKLHRYRRHT